MSWPRISQGTFVISYRGHRLRCSSRDAQPLQESVKFHSHDLWMKQWLRLGRTLAKPWTWLDHAWTRTSSRYFPQYTLLQASCVSWQLRAMSWDRAAADRSSLAYMYDGQKKATFVAHVEARRSSVRAWLMSAHLISSHLASVINGQNTRQESRQASQEMQVRSLFAQSTRAEPDLAVPAHT